MSAHDTAAGVVSPGSAGSAAAQAAEWGGGQLPAPVPVNVPGVGLTMLGSVDGGDACADGSCAVAIVNPAG